MKTTLKTHQKKWKRLRLELATLSNEALHEKALSSARSQNEQVAHVVASMAEILRRKNFLNENTSIYQYAKKVLGLSDGSAQRRAVAAKLALEYPETIENIASGQLSLEGAMTLWIGFQNQKSRAAKEIMRLKKHRHSQKKTQTLISPNAQSQAPTSESLLFQTKPLASPPNPHVREASKEEKRNFIKKMEGKSRTEILKNLGEMDKALGLSLDDEGQRPRGIIKPLSRNWTEVKIILDPERLAKLKHLQDLMSRKVPNGDINQIFDLMLEKALDQFDPARKEERIQNRRLAAKAKESAQTEVAIKAKTPGKVSAKNIEPLTSVKDSIRDNAPNPRSGVEWGAGLAADSMTNLNQNHLLEGVNLLKRRKLTTNNPAGELQKIRHEVWGEGVMILLNEAPGSVTKKSFSRTYFSADVQRAALLLAGNQCEWVDMKSGKRCKQRRLLELDHVVPVRAGGESFAWNARCLCRFHNVQRNSQDVMNSQEAKGSGGNFEYSKNVTSREERFVGP
jgi:hypothetical protein